MKAAPILIPLWCILAAGVFAQEPASNPAANDQPPVVLPAEIPPQPSPAEAAPTVPPAPDVSQAPTASQAPAAPSSETDAAAAETRGAREMPLDAEPFDVRVHRRVEEYNQRHQQRQRQMAAYNKVGGSDPSLGRFADPRKTQVEIGDELDRERTCQDLAGDYAEQAHNVESKMQALREFITKRRQTVDELSKHDGARGRQDLEVALHNLARQPESPETLAQMREIDRRLSEADHNERNLPAQLSQGRQEAESATQELNKLVALEQLYQKQSKAFTQDAFSARQNRLRLADRLEYYVVLAQAEDELEQGRKAIAVVQRIPASPEVEATLSLSGSSTKSDEALQRLRDCLRESEDVKACREKTHQE